MSASGPKASLVAQIHIPGIGTVGSFTNRQRERVRCGVRGYRFIVSLLACVFLLFRLKTSYPLAENAVSGARVRHWLVTGKACLGAEHGAFILLYRKQQLPASARLACARNVCQNRMRLQRSVRFIYHARGQMTFPKWLRKRTVPEGWFGSVGLMDGFGWVAKLAAIVDDDRAAGRRGRLYEEFRLKRLKYVALDECFNEIMFWVMITSDQ